MTALHAVPQDAWVLMALVFVLGLKHGIDADHLVAVDGLTRFNALERPSLARWCGLLFSLGHGSVVVAVALALGFVTGKWIVPDWLEHLGAWISIGFLVLLGTLNFAAVLRTPAERMVQTVAVKGRLLTRITRTTQPAAILAVGALFAVSFDAMSQAALFALAAAQYGGWHHIAALGLLFMLGMMATDGANGWWIAALLNRADRRARIASRVMGLAVAALSFGVAAFGAAKWLSPEVAVWSDGRELAVGAAVLMIVAAAFVGALLASRATEARGELRG